MKLSFEEFKIKCKRIIYVADEKLECGEEICTENIKCVELFEDDFEMYYKQGLTPLEAIEEYRNSYDC